MFTLPPLPTDPLILFTTQNQKLTKLLSWNLISKTAKEKSTIKPFRYYSCDTPSPILCDIIGYIPYNTNPNAPDTAVIQINNKQSKIMPAYLKDMQRKDFNPRSQEESETEETKEIEEIPQLEPLTLF